METHWIDSPKYQAERKELADLCERNRTPAEDARLTELKARVRNWARLNQAAEDFVNGAPRTSGHCARTSIGAVEDDGLAFRTSSYRQGAER